MTRIVRCWLVAGVAALAAVLAGPSTSIGLTAMRDRAGSATHRSGAVVLHLKFRRTGSAEQVLVGRGYVFLDSTTPTFFGGTLIDERTGQRTTIARPGCVPGFFGGPWLLFECGTPRTTQLALYRPAARTWRLVNWNPNTLGSPDAVGAYWIESVLGADCSGPQGDHCDSVPHYAFTRIGTGAQGTVDWVPDGDIVPGLDSPSLAHKLCSPLRVPHVSFPTDVGDAVLPGTVTMFGQFAIASGTSWGPMPRSRPKIASSAATPSYAGRSSQAPP